MAGPDTIYISTRYRELLKNNRLTCLRGYKILRTQVMYSEQRYPKNWEKKSTLQAGPDTGYISVRNREMQNNNMSYNNRGQFYYVLIY